MITRRKSHRVADRYSVEIVPVSSIQPSPENDNLYGEVTHDEKLSDLVSSIRRLGLAQPIIVSEDDFIISGHRRYAAIREIGIDEVPITRWPIRRTESLERWPKLLADFNPQRVKSAASLLKEALVRHANNPAALLVDREKEKLAAIEQAIDYMTVKGTKTIKPVSDNKQQFLGGVLRVVESLRDYWPVTLRTIHYQLLNHPPLTLTPKRSKYSLESKRYQNNKASYDSLKDLVKVARYCGHIPMVAIDDPTRPQYANNGFSSLASFLERETNGFLVGYHRDLQQDQPKHIEVFGEKNTLISIIKPVCEKLYVPLTIARGYASTPAFRDIVGRFRRSGKDRLTLLVLSDYDPEGFDLADDAVRTLRDLWGIEVDYHRVGVTDGQVNSLNLHGDFNPAKVESSRFKAFVERTGSSKSWELEALPPHYIRSELEKAIKSNMDLELFEKTLEMQDRELIELAEIRQQIVGALNF
jgi:hypothetical protein